MHRTHVIHEHKNTARYIIHDPEVLELQEAVELFAGHGAARAPLAGGRGGAWELTFNNETLVLRRYKRGGVAQRFAQDRYVWTGISSTRPWQEWLLLFELWEKNLPVPRPVAAQVVRSGFIYQAEIMTKKIEDAQSLAWRAVHQRLALSDWHRIGKCIRGLHDAEVFHADLNAHNVLMDEHDKVWIIDLDRGKLKPMIPMWKMWNLKRLKRSLDKVLAQHPSMSFSPQAWKALLTSYKAPKNKV